MDMFKPLNAHAQIGVLNVPVHAPQHPNFSFQPRRVNFTQEERMRLLSLVHSFSRVFVYSPFAVVLNTEYV